MEIKTEVALMQHEGGTKFYEVAQFSNPAAGRNVVVFRWGKMSEIRGGGQIKIEHHPTKSKADASARKKINEKGGRGYMTTAVRSPTAGMPSSFDADIARLKIAEHFDDTDTVDAIVSGLGISDVLTEASERDLNHLFGRDDVVVEEPEPEIIRGDDWASW